MLRLGVGVVALAAMLNGCASDGGRVAKADEPVKPTADTLPEAVPAAKPAVDPRDQTIKALREALRQVNGELAQLKAGQKSAKPRASGAAEVDLDVYERNLGRSAHNRVVLALRERGFVPDYPELPHGMGMASKTTVFYYDTRFIHTAGVVAQELASVLKSNVTIQKGVSPLPANKLVVQISGFYRK